MRAGPSSDGDSQTSPPWCFLTTQTRARQPSQTPVAAALAQMCSYQFTCGSGFALLFAPASLTKKLGISAVCRHEREGHPSGSQEVPRGTGIRCGGPPETQHGGAAAQQFSGSEHHDVTAWGGAGRRRNLGFNAVRIADRPQVVSGTVRHAVE